MSFRTLSDNKPYVTNSFLYLLPFCQDNLCVHIELSNFDLQVSLPDGSFIIHYVIKLNLARPTN